MKSLLMNPQKRVLSNGVRVYGMTRDFTPLVSIRFSFDVEPWKEGLEKAGLQWTLSKMLLEGSQRKSFSQLHEEMESTGSDWNSCYDGVQVHCLQSELKTVLEIICETLSTPELKRERFDRLVQRRTQELRSALEDADNLSGYLLRESIYRGTGQEFYRSGNPQSLESLNFEDLQSLHAKIIVSGRLKVLCSGNFDLEEVCRMLEKNLKLNEGDTESNPPQVLNFRQQISRQLVVRKRKKVALALGHRGVRRYCEEQGAFRVLDQIIGSSNGFTSRLANELREKQGLCYSIFGDFLSSSSRIEGMFLVGIGTNPKRAQRALDSIQGVLGELLESGPDKDEVEDACKYLLGSMSFAWESNQSVLQLMMDQVHYQLEEDFLIRERERIEKTDREEVHTLAKNYLNVESLHMVAVGDVELKGFERLDEIPGLNSKARARELEEK